MYKKVSISVAKSQVSAHANHLNAMLSARSAAVVRRCFLIITFVALPIIIGDATISKHITLPGSEVHQLIHLFMII